MIIPIGQNFSISNSNYKNNKNAITNKNNGEVPQFKGLEEDITRRSLVQKTNKVSQIAKMKH